MIELWQEISGIGRIFIQHPGITPSAGYLASVAAAVTGHDAREPIALAARDLRSWHAAHRTTG